MQAAVVCVALMALLLAGAHPLRFVGATGTYLGAIALAVAMLAEGT